MSKKTYKRIKNFSTSINPEKTISEIEKMLASYGATKIMKQYDNEGNPILLAFIIQTSHGEMPIKLPINIEGIQSVFKEQVSKGNLPKSYWDSKEQAMKVGWRILKDWIDVQLTMLQVKNAKIEQIFLSYIYDVASDKTMYEVIEEKGFKFPAIENNKMDVK